MEIKDKDFERVAKYFMQSRKITGEFSIEKIVGGSPTNRLLRVGKRRIFMIKLLTELFPSDKNTFHLQNEIAIQEIIRSLGLFAKRYLLVELSFDNPTGVSFAVSTYIPGRSLVEVDEEEITFLVPKVLDYLFFLHSRTISQSFGYLREGVLRESILPFGQFESAYLWADIQRDDIKFLPQEEESFRQAVEHFNQVELFCLCHWDVTRGNTLWDGFKVHLIDWSYAHYADPASDIAGVIFWLMELGLRAQIRRELTRSHERYQRLGFNIVSTLPFYLGQRYIEVGRLRGKRYIEKGKEFLECTPRSLEELIRAITPEPILKG